MNERNGFAIVRRPMSSVERTATGARRVLAGMVFETLALAEEKALITLSPKASALLQSWCQKGEDHYDGKGVPQNYVEAAKWFRMAAEKGHARAQSWLGSLFEGGNGVVQNLDEAIAWYRKSAEQGDIYGQYCLGECYLNGIGVTENYNESAKWFRKAAEQGDAWSQYHLGSFYEGGDGVPQDYAEAVRWYQMAAKNNFENAMFRLSSLFLNGDGVEQDLVEAYKWLKLATEENDFWEKKLNSLRSLLTKEQIAEAEKRYREFQSSKK